MVLVEQLCLLNLVVVILVGYFVHHHFHYNFCGSLLCHGWYLCIEWDMYSHMYLGGGYQWTYTFQHKMSLDSTWASVKQSSCLCSLASSVFIVEKYIWVRPHQYDGTMIRGDCCSNPYVVLKCFSTLGLTIDKSIELTIINA